VDFVKDSLTKDEEKEPGAQPVPAELLVTLGRAGIPKTSLLHVTNSDDDIFMDTKGQQDYTWRAAGSVQNPSRERGEQLPRDFTRISLESPKSHVLASIPGTEQAKEAVIANQIPQTASVNRKEAKLKIRYTGPPQFKPIESTNLEYAINTSSEVIHAEGRYYAIEHGVWFVSDSPLGPWLVAEMIPAAIYSIPPSSPLYHVRFAYVYGATPEVVYVGYTPGYLGAFVSNGVVVFSTGWWYPGVFCGDFWCGRPWTWGLGFRFSYWGGGWFWRPIGHHWWYHTTPVVHRVFGEHWNPHWSSPNRTWIHGNVNAYSH
jgi:hypothetical protein